MAVSRFGCAILGMIGAASLSMSAAFADDATQRANGARIAALAAAQSQLGYPVISTQNGETCCCSGSLDMSARYATISAQIASLAEAAATPRTVAPVSAAALAEGAY